MIEKADKLWHLERFSVIQVLSMKERIALRDMATMKSYKKGETIYFSSNACENVFFLKKGNIKVSRITSLGDDQALEIIGPGELFGKYGMNDEDGNDEVAVALKDSLICYLNVKEWNKFILNNPRFNFSVLKIIGFKIRRLETRIEQLQLLSISERIRVVLKQLTEKYAKTLDHPNRKELSLNLTHNDIAKLSGTSRQSTTSELNELKRQGIVSYNRSRIIIEDYCRL